MSTIFNVSSGLHLNVTVESMACPDKTLHSQCNVLVRCSFGEMKEYTAALALSKCPTWSLYDTLHITMSRKLLSWATSSHVSCAIICMCFKATLKNLSGSMVRTPTRCCCFMRYNRSSLQNGLHVPNWLHVGEEKLTTPQRSRKAYKHTPNKSSGSSMHPVPPQDVALIPTSLTVLLSCPYTVHTVSF